MSQRKILGDIVFHKEYGTPKAHIAMEYVRTKTEPRKVKYYREIVRMPDEEANKYNKALGIYCLKCGEFHEYVEEEMRTLYRSYIPCKCGEKKTLPNCIDANGKVDSLDALPYKLELIKHKGKIHISAMSQNYRFNAKAIKPYTRKFQITVIINPETGQAYCMPARYKNKIVFGPDDVRTASFSHNPVLSYISRTFFENDEEAMAALNKLYADICPEMAGDYSSLQDLVRANYLKNLYACFPKADEHPDYVTIHMWKMLKKRYKRNPDTFPKYLWYGCSKIATKSIRKQLFKHPDQKWTLLFLYKTLGLENPDIIRQLLTDSQNRADGIAKYMLFETFGKAKTLEQIRMLADACRNAGMTEKQMAKFFVTGNTGTYLLRDTARLYENNPIPPEELRKCKTAGILHDKLIETDLRINDPQKWSRYDEKVTYSDFINRLEVKSDDTSFTIIRRPWDLDALSDRFHNCVHLYKEDVKQKHSIIIEMTINGKPSACIELDETGKYYRQAYAACNAALQGNAARKFNEWAEKYDIKPGNMMPHVNGFPPFMIQGGFDEFVPF